MPSKKSANFIGYDFLLETKVVSSPHINVGAFTTQKNVKAESKGNLVLNQNFAPNWKAANGKKVESYDGLVSTKVTPKDEQITFYYLPISFIAGSILSLSSILLSIFLWRHQIPISKPMATPYDIQKE